MRLLPPIMILFAALAAQVAEYLVFGPAPAPALDCETDAECEAACLARGADDCPYPY